MENSVVSCRYLQLFVICFEAEARHCKFTTSDTCRELYTVRVKDNKSCCNREKIHLHKFWVSRTQEINFTDTLLLFHQFKYILLNEKLREFTNKGMEFNGKQIMFLPLHPQF